ncbi:MAG: class I SAM-dependent methyltransferase, partial [Polyangiaceae bacterium]
MEGWTDPGEHAAVAFVADEAHGAPILDLGVGAGRTVPLMRAISEDYVALDYTPELVGACKHKYPDVRVLPGDARDLSRFPDATFKLVMFSFNGIDAVDPVGREKILDEVFRVLRPGGIFLFSAHNREGPGNGEKLSFGVGRTRNPFKLAWRLARAALHVRRAMKNHARYAKLGFDGDGYSIKNASAHDHGIMVYYTSLANQLKELERAGFRPGTIVFGNDDGRRIQTGDDVTSPWWFH